ncbi:MAG: hypothetical protein AB1505_09385 [Candidatus Latescibacterota bacterium]
MRTTLTLDDDVAAQLTRLRESRSVPLRSLINNALREGLRLLAEPERPRPQHSTKEVALGRCLLGSVDDIGEALSIAEGERFR